MKMKDMRQRMPGIYEVRLSANQNSIDEINIFLIPGKKGERSLMIDAGFKKRSCLAKMEKVLFTLGITYDKLDIFLTHKHHDHSGLASEYASLGARILMNPEENRHHYDCLYYNHDHGTDEDQYRVLRSVGVTPEGTPEIWEMFMEIRRRVMENRGWEFEVHQFPYMPVMEGQVLNYGNLTFEAVLLKGHTYGQMGLYERKHRILFCADQVIDGIVPIVGTTYPDEHLLEGYFKSLERFKHEFADCTLFPAHREPITDVKKVVNRIIFAYLDKTDIMKHILDRSKRRMTTKEVACLAYGMENIPEDTKEFIKLKMVMSKTFSCLEYLRDLDFAIRTEENGTYYWQSPEL